MAAADYFNGGLLSRPPMPTSQQPSNKLTPPTRPQRASSHPNVQFASPPPQQSYQQLPSPYLQNPGPPPPPYEPIPQPQVQQHKPSVHFAPTPSSYHRPNSFSSPRPNPQDWASTPYNPQYNPQYPHPAQQQLMRPQQPPQPAQPYQHNYSHRPSGPLLAPTNTYAIQESPSGYTSDPEHHHRDRHRRRRHHSSSSPSRPRSSSSKRRTSSTSRSTTADGFLGAAGGGLIGDLIFPGLGTVGGALAGWFGGKDYGSRRKAREDRRDESQWKWEERWGREHSRERWEGGRDSKGAADGLRYGDEGGYVGGGGRRRSYDDRDHKRY